MDADSSLERPVVWRTSTPSPAELELALRRLREAALLKDRPANVPPFVVVTPSGLRRRETLTRALEIRGVRVVERRTITNWARIASVLSLPAGGFDTKCAADALALEEVWRGLFPRDEAELWVLADDRSLERARAWRASLGESVRGVQVTLQDVRDSRTLELGALHVPASHAVEREWLLLGVARASAA